MILLGVDFGTKRIGLATASTEARLPRPLPALPSSGALKRDAENIAAKANAEGANAIVLGLPINDQGSDRMERVCRSLGDLLKGHGFQVHFVDEGMSSYLSEGTMIEAGIKASQRKRRLDGEAAATILERFLSENDV